MSSLLVIFIWGGVAILAEEIYMWWTDCDIQEEINFCNNVITKLTPNKMGKSKKGQNV
jgi:hypothetical protein